MKNYVLNEHGEQVPVADVIEWAKWFHKADRHVASDRFGNVHVSTVFLGVDHQFGEGPPVLWETMIFGGVHDLYQERYTSREDAIVGHNKAVELVRRTEGVSNG